MWEVLGDSVNSLQCTHLLVTCHISMDSWFLIVFNGISTLTIIIYSDGPIALSLAHGSLCELVSLSFCDFAITS